MTRITLLDGGMGQELVARSGDAPTPLWATRVMIDHPDLVRAIHDDYFAAGATVATTNTYAIHHDRLERFGLDDRFEDLHRAALDAARAARDAHGSGRIAGSIGPLVATYRDDVVLPVDEAAPKVAEVARLLTPNVDIILLETLSTVTQAEGR
jgi:homocysteine S-methyltransferase